MAGKTQLEVLICGAGIAGPALAYHLTRIPCDHVDLSITIVERSPSPRKTGQGIDIRGPAVKVIQHMGLEADIRRVTTKEKGIEKIGSTGRVIAVFNSTGDTSRQAFTSEFEILRADLARIFTEAATHRPGVRIIYGEYISAISQPSDGSGPVHVEFTNGRLPAGTYDLVVGADGFLSRTRALATGRPAKEAVRDLGGTYVAYFTKTPTPADSPTHGRVYNAPGSRVITTRPSPAGTSVFLSIVRPDEPALPEAAGMQDVGAQKALMAHLFAGAGWETPRIIASMHDADDFYLQQIGQIKCASWSVGRVVLVGDAGYCPSGITGFGTSLAIYGGYVLAGEIGRALREGRSLSDALVRYESTARPYVERAQEIPPGAPWLLHPKTRLGVWILNTVAAILYRSGVFSLFQRFGTSRSVEKDPLPIYEWADA